MRNICEICTHTKRLQIDRDVVSGRNLTQTAKKYAVSYQSLYNHARNHISRQLVQAYKKKEMDHNLDLLQRIDQIVARAEDIFHRNYEAGRDVTALKALSEQRQTFELLAKISYALHEAKLYELEQKREDDQTEAKKEFTSMLQILNTAELEMFEKLQDKMIKADPSIVVIPENKEWEKMTRKTPLTRTNPQRANKYNTPEEKPQENAGKQPTSEDNPERDTIKPVPPTLIPSPSSGLRLQRWRLERAARDSQPPDDRFPVDDPSEGLKKF